MNDFYKERLSALKTKTIGKLLVFLSYQHKMLITLDLKLLTIKIKVVNCTRLGNEA